MMTRDPYLSDKCGEVENLLRDAAGWAARDEKLGAHLAAYLAVSIVGVVEDCIEHLVHQRVGQIQDPEVQHYVTQAVSSRFRNPTHATIMGLLNQFSAQYGQEFARRIPPNGQEASALYSIMNNKNDLAHKGTRNLGMTVGNVDDYYHRVVPILETLEAILLPTAL